MSSFSYRLFCLSCGDICRAASNLDNGHKKIAYWRNSSIEIGLSDHRVIAGEENKAKSYY